MRRGHGAAGLSHVVVALALSAASAPAWAAPRDKPASAAATIRACTGKALPEYRKGACLDDAAKALREHLGDLVERRLAAIAAVATRPPSPGSLAGREDAENWRKAFLAAQGAWEEYYRRHCDSLYDFDYHGGSAAGQFASSCKIRLLAARIDELQEQVP